MATTGKSTFIAFSVEKQFNNGARYKPNKFKLSFPNENNGVGARIHAKTIEVSDDLADELTEIAQGSNDAKPVILMENGIDGWEIVKPIKIKRS